MLWFSLFSTAHRHQLSWVVFVFWKKKKTERIHYLHDAVCVRGSVPVLTPRVFQHIFGFVFLLKSIADFVLLLNSFFESASQCHSHVSIFLSPVRELRVFIVGKSKIGHQLTKVKSNINFYITQTLRSLR